MSDLPRKAVTRTAKLAALPLGMAGRATLGLGKRLGGRPADVVAAELQQRTADQLFRVLGELKGSHSYGTLPLSCKNTPGGAHV